MNKASLNFQKCFYLFFRFQALLFMEIKGGDSTIQMFIYPLGQGQYYYMQCSKRA